MFQALFLMLISSASVAVSQLNFYQVQSRYWNGDRTRDLPLTSDIRSQDSKTQLLQCVMQLSRRWELGPNECLVFQPGSASPCFIGSLSAHYCENLRPLNNATEETLVKVFVTNMNRESSCIMIQHRISNSTSFIRNWTEYANGFGEGPTGNFWIGLETISNLTRSNPRALFIEMTLWNGSIYWASYSSFQIANASNHYRLTTLGSFKASRAQLGDCMANCLGQNFSTFDADYDSKNSGSCSIVYKGGWWYNACMATNPNGLYLVPPDALDSAAYAVGIVWDIPFGYRYSMKEFKMMIW